MHQLLDCCAYDNCWSRKHPAEKLLLGGGMMALSVALPPPAGLVVMVVMGLVTMLGPRISPGVYLRVLAIPASFILLGVASVMLSVSMDQNSWPSLGLAPDGPRVAWGILNRSLGASSAMLFLALTTPVSEWLSLVRHPALREIGDLAHLVYRFVFAFFRTAQTIRIAQEARNGYRTRGLGIRSLGMLSARLLVRALDRVRGMEMGLAARGYDGTVRLLSRQNRLCWRTLGGFLAMELAVVLFVLWYGRVVHAG